MFLLRPAFRHHGKHFIFDSNGYYDFEFIEVGDYVSINKNAIFMATESSIIIGNKVMIGPNVTIIGGNHNPSQLGKFMYDVHEKRDEDDQDVIIEDDVWVGCGAIILKGVRIGRGSIVAAGALVNKDVLPYNIVAGIPANTIRTRFDNLETLRNHDAALYPPNRRLSDEVLKKALEHAQRN
jgi:acetyltransferase-like isoleucine patch superfamily enzyme